MKMFSISVMALASIAVAPATVAIGAPTKPNMVFILADDLGWADVGFHGGNAPTPHLDRLAAEGLELTQHYVAPVCSPTRAGFLTGCCWSRFDVTTPQNTRALPPETVTLPRALQAAGYETCLTGKWHLGSMPEWGPNHYGFDHSYGSLAGGVAPWRHLYKRGPYSETWHRNEQLLRDDGHVTDLLVEEAIRWLGGRGEKPFFLYVPFTAVHLPVQEPDEWLARVPAKIEGEVPRHYAACIMHLDDAVGRLVAALDEAGFREETLIVFTSDNGGSTAENNGQDYPENDYPEGRLPATNAPLRGQKGSLYEGGIRAATIVNWPGTLQRGQCSVPLHITDWMPTFCSLAGYVTEQDLNWDGTNIWPILTGSAKHESRPLYWAGTGYRSRALRDGDWKLIVHGRDDALEKELFNLARDPGEHSNLAPRMPDKVAQMEATLTQIAEADGDAAVP